MNARKNQRGSVHEHTLASFLLGRATSEHKRDEKPSLRYTLPTPPPTKSKCCAGFTLIEILVVMGIIAILAAIVLIALNPARQFAQARNSQRISNVNAILNAVGQNIADNLGLFECATPLPNATTTIGDDETQYNLRDCVVPTYMPEIPTDPKSGRAWDGTAYNTDYYIVENPITGRITIGANNPELDESIEVTR